MAHFAKVLNGIVQNVIVAEPGFFDTFVDTSPGEWIQTSYNTRGGVHYGPDGQPDGGTPLRKNYAVIGGVYDRARDAFYEQKPYPSWILNEQSCIWHAPKPRPDYVQPWVWDEALQEWIILENGA